MKEIEAAANEEDLVARLQLKQQFVFFRVSLVDENGRTLYESHMQQPKDQRPTSSPEVQEALKYGIGYSEGFSQLFNQTFAYVAKSFSLQGKTYVVRTAFPFEEVEELTDDFELGFLTLGVIVLLLYSLMTWIIIHRLSSPIQQILNAVKPYQEKGMELLPRIQLKESKDPEDDFNKLAQTLNSLSEKIQKQMETVIHQRNENESILDSLLEGVVALNAQHMVIYVNPMACKMLEVKKEALLGQSFGQKESLLMQKCKDLLALCQQKESVLRKSLIFEEEKKVHIDIIAIPRLFQSGAILVLQDKSMDVRMLEMGKDFIANASHELRTPITIIRGFAETLQDLPDLSPAMLKQITEKIVRTCDRLNNLVKNILLLADMENVASSRFHGCDLGAILENCKHMLLSVHEEVSVSIDQKKEEIKILADPDLIELALMNLLENAVKYSAGVPEIAIFLDQNDQEVCLRVEDKGIGIPAQDLGRIFERFYTVDKARSRRHGGAGLGLSIVKTIVEKHGGKINVTSQVGIGTAFQIQLPVFL